MRALRHALAAAVVTAAAHGAIAHELPAGAPRQEFVAPAPGSYALPPIQNAPAQFSIDAQGRAVSLGAFWRHRLVLLSLFYADCDDAQGCPLALSVIAALADQLAADPRLSRRVGLLSLSFDPQRDTPAALAKLARHFHDPASPVRWTFAAMRPADVDDLLDAFDQDIAPERDHAGRPNGQFNHLLKVFLIDRRGQVREIYTTAFLMPEIMLNDIKTLLLEDGVALD
ncbi:MAG: SCO family protein [Alphaproteobacteria bacterium]|nr:SCO family protein [Alphaproteobacteria bacterium]